MSRFLYRNLELLEPYEGKLSCTVLRGESSRKGADLPDQSSLYLSTIYEAIIAKQEILRAKMQQYNDVKLYLFSFILPEYSSNEYIVNSLKLYNENELFPIIITSITYKEVDNPRIAFKNENGIIHLVLCFEHDKED